MGFPDDSAVKNLTSVGESQDIHIQSLGWMKEWKLAVIISWI